MDRDMENIIREKDELLDLVEDLLTKIQEIREEFTAELDELECMITER